MPLTQAQIEKFCKTAEKMWAENRKFMVATKCTACGQVRKCITSVVDLSTTCKECYIKGRLKKMEEDERKAKIQTNLKDFVKL